MESFNGGVFEFTIAVDVDGGNVADRPVHELSDRPFAIRGLRRRDFKSPFLAGDQSAHLAVLFEAAVAVVLGETFLEDANLQGAGRGVFANPDFAGV